MAQQAQFDLPKTAHPAPPSFYNNVGAMSGSGAGHLNPPNPQQPPAAVGADTQKFTEMTSKLLTVLDAMQQMKPNGMDVSKYTQAAADAMKDCLKNVLAGEKNQPPGTPGAAADQATIPGDQTAGDQGGAIAGPAAQGGVAA